MSTLQTTARPLVPIPATAARPRGILFWVRRYLPAELIGTAVLLVAGLGVMVWTDHPFAVAAAAVVGENIGFYGVLATVVLLEQRRLGRTGFRVVAATAVLLIAEFGGAEVLDTLLIRPAAISFAVWLIPDPVWALLIGKVAADLVFYALAAVAFVLTTKTRLRRPAEPTAAGRPDQEGVHA
jgi:hypothetical protein